MFWNAALIKISGTGMFRHMYKMFLNAQSFDQDLSSGMCNVTNMEMFNGTQSLSDYNKCAINATFSSNDNWPYNWGDLCYFWPQSNDELGVAVDLWCDDNEAALELYGPINDWDVSLITSMSYLFMNKSAFNSDNGNWDVSNVTTMVEMFKNTSFNQDLSNWDVSNVTNMVKCSMVVQTLMEIYHNGMFQT